MIFIFRCCIISLSSSGWKRYKEALVIKGVIMTDNQQEKEVGFSQDIFPSELQEVAARRKRRKLDNGLIEKAAQEKNTPCSDTGLVGLALSGGGIRSSTFSLGVVQELVQQGIFKFVDYLSTVSGGGYLGSCLSSILNKPDATDTPFENRYGADDTPVVKHMRNSSNYLSPPGFLNTLRLPLVVIRGIVWNLFLLIPYIMAAVAVTEILNEVMYPLFYSKMIWLLYVFLGVVGGGLLLTYPYILKVARLKWGKRNSYDLVLSGGIFMLLVLLGFVQIMRIVSASVNFSYNDMLVFFNKYSANLQWTGIIFVVVAALLYSLPGEFFSKLKKSSLSLFVSILGPAIVFAIYLGVCIAFIESPFIKAEYEGILNQSLNKMELTAIKETDLAENEKVFAREFGELLTEFNQKEMLAGIEEKRMTVETLGKLLNDKITRLEKGLIEENSSLGFFGQSFDYMRNLVFVDNSRKRLKKING
ncbi:MAG: hypothetical protein GY765_42660, partial [bacterium]|nr:hypothetical protein [bacterium]